MKYRNLKDVNPQSSSESSEETRNSVESVTDFSLSCLRPLKIYKNILQVPDFLEPY